MGRRQFNWRDAKNPRKKGYTAWSAFEAGTADFKPRKKPCRLNFRAANLKRVLAELKKEGVRVDPNTEESELDKFVWVMDCEDNRIELWQPPRDRSWLRKAREAGSARSTDRVS